MSYRIEIKSVNFAFDVEKKEIYADVLLEYEDEEGNVYTDKFRNYSFYEINSAALYDAITENRLNYIKERIFKYLEHSISKRVENINVFLEKKSATLRDLNNSEDYFLENLQNFIK